MSDVEFIATDKLKTLIDLTARINSYYSDLDALMTFVLESAMRLVECESSSLLIKNKEDDFLHFSAALGPKGAEAKSIPVEKNSIAGWVYTNSKPVMLNNVPDDSRFSDNVQLKTGYETRTMIAIPMCYKETCFGVLELLNKSGTRLFDKNDLELARILADQASIAYQNAETYQNAKNEITILQDNISAGPNYHTFVAKSKISNDLIKIVDGVARSNASVLITGESGVGKELVAEQLHLRSARRDKPFVRVNCAALSSSLIESELFGHVKGAYTDASSTVKGRFEMADGGTLFLDEIGEIPVEFQSKLLRAIQDKKFERVGSSETISVDVRIIAATNRNLEQMVEEGKFRNDLFYRLNVVPVKIPPLRRRPEDIEPLANFFLRKFSLETKKNFKGFSPEAEKLLYEYNWPGNIRELENSVERACVLGTPPFINSSDMLISGIKGSSQEKSVSEISFAADNDKSLKTVLNSFKRQYVMKILNQTGWNQTKAAQILDIQRTYLARLLTELNIRGEK